MAIILSITCAQNGDLKPSKSTPWESAFSPSLVSPCKPTSSSILSNFWGRSFYNIGLPIHMLYSGQKFGYGCPHYWTFFQILEKILRKCTLFTSSTNFYPLGEVILNTLHLAGHQFLMLLDSQSAKWIRVQRAK